MNDHQSLYTVTMPEKDPYYFPEENAQMKRLVHDLKVRGIPYEVRRDALSMYDGIAPLTTPLLPYTKMDVSFDGEDGERKLFSGTFANDKDVMQTIRKLIGKKTENYREHCDMTQPVHPEKAKYQAVLHAKLLKITLTPTRPIEKPLKGKEAVDLVADEILSSEPRITPIYGKPLWDSRGLDTWIQYDLDRQKYCTTHQSEPKEFYIVTVNNPEHPSERTPVGFSTEVAAGAFATIAEENGLSPERDTNYLFDDQPIDPAIYQTMVDGWEPNTNRLFVVPENDAEAIEIHKMLEDRGDVEVLTTSQAWNVSWDDLEPDVMDEVRQAAAEGREVYGVELQGDAPDGCSNIDHHTYPEDDRSHPLSSIEQVARIMSIDLTRRQMLVAANDRSDLGALKQLKATPEEITDVQQEDQLAKSMTVVTKEKVQDKEMFRPGTPEYGKKIMESLGHTKKPVGRSTSAPALDDEAR